MLKLTITSVNRHIEQSKNIIFKCIIIVFQIENLIIEILLGITNSN